MANKYRIRKVASDNGDRYYPEVKGWFGWRHVDLRVGTVVVDGLVQSGVTYAHIRDSMSLEDAKACIDYRVAQDNEREEIIDYP